MDYDESDESYSALLGSVEETGDTGAGRSSLATAGPRDSQDQVNTENSPSGDWCMVVAISYIQY